MANAPPCLVNLQALLVEQNLPQPHRVHGQGAKIVVGLDDEAVLVLLGQLTCGAKRVVPAASGAPHKMTREEASTCAGCSKALEAAAGKPFRLDVPIAK